MGWLRKSFKKIGNGIKSAFMKFGKFMGKIGVVGQIAMMFILPGIGAALLKGVTGAFGAIVGQTAAQAGAAAAGTAAAGTAATTTAVTAALAAVAACAPVVPTIAPKAPVTPFINAAPIPGKINIIAI